MKWKHVTIPSALAPVCVESLCISFEHFCMYVNAGRCLHVRVGILHLSSGRESERLSR